jgi:hypothetical protein
MVRGFEVKKVGKKDCYSSRIWGRVENEFFFFSGQILNLYHSSSFFKLRQI